jgi:hypothetical protein
MENFTSVAVECDCRIPFHDELMRYFRRLFLNGSPRKRIKDCLLHREAIVEALRRRTIFIKLTSDTPGARLRPQALREAKKILGKDVVAMMTGERNITVVMM